MSAHAVRQQAPAALLAVVQHIHLHDLGAPISIQTPSHAAPWFSLAVVSSALDKWIASGLTVTDTKVEARHGRIAERSWERVQVDGLLQPFGIRVQLVAMRPLLERPTLVVVPQGAGAIA